MVRENIFEPLPGFGFRGRCHRTDHTGAAGQRRQIRQLAGAQQQPGAGAVPLLRHRGDHFIAQRFHQPPQFLEAGFVRDVGDVRRLDADEDGKRDRGFGFHAPCSSTDRSEAWKLPRSVEGGASPPLILVPRLSKTDIPSSKRVCSCQPNSDARQPIPLQFGPAGKHTRFWSSSAAC